MTSIPPNTLERLLQETDWIVRLARSLCRDPSAADDVAQEVWTDVLQNEPQVVRQPRAFLATIARRLAARRSRGEQRRERRQQERARTTDGSGGDVPPAVDHVARVAMHRELSDAVLGLAEPYRETISLRFFEDLDADAIAQRMHCPPNTVRTRLQRGLRMLRERLDRLPGGRERWLPAMLVLARRPLGKAAVAGSVGSGLVVLGLTMKPILFAVAAIAAVLLFVRPFAAAPTSPTPTTSRHEVQAAAAVPPATRESGSAIAAAERSAVDVAPAIAPAVVDAGTPQRRLVDATGQPLAAVRMRAATATTVRWQGGDRGWINGPEGTRRLSAEDELRLQQDPAFADEFFAALTRPDEWRATLLGAELPGDVLTAADGSFAFDGTVADRDVMVADPAWVLVARGNSTEPWVAGPSARVEGRCCDEQGQPVDDAFVIAIAKAPDGKVEMADQLETRSDGNGRFLLRKALANGLVRVRHAGYATALVSLGPEARQAPEIVLRRAVDGAAPTVAGIVVDVGGRPIAAASIWLDRQQAKSDERGTFSFAATDTPAAAALTVIAKGYALLQLDGIGARIGAADERTDDLVLVLGERPARAQGIVFGSDGVPMAGALVGLVDPTLLDLSFESVEARIGAFTGGVVTGADGTFELGGLAARAYRFAAIDPATGARVTSLPTRAGDGPIVLRLPRDVRRSVRGRVVAEGQPLLGATVEIGYCTYITKGGGTMFDSTAAVRCDDEGRFVLPAMPRTSAYLVVRQGDGVVDALPVELFADDEELTVDCARRRWLQLVGSAFGKARSIALQDEAGKLTPALDLRGQPALLAADGSAPVLPLPAEAVAVVIARGTDHEQRLELTDDRAVHLRVR